VRRTIKARSYDRLRYADQGAQMLYVILAILFVVALFAYVKIRGKRLG
jgi:Tfp pilus assembly protein PilX